MSSHFVIKTIPRKLVTESSLVSYIDFGTRSGLVASDDELFRKAHFHSQFSFSAVSRYLAVKYSTVLRAPASTETQLKAHDTQSTPPFTNQRDRADMIKIRPEKKGRLWMMPRLAIWRCSAMESAMRRRQQVRSEVVVAIYSSYSSSSMKAFWVTLLGMSVSEWEVELVLLSDVFVFVVVGEIRGEGEGEGEVDEEKEEEEEELQRESSDSIKSIYRKGMQSI